MSRRNLLIGITGSIAAKKTIDLIKLLDSNYNIKVICTYEGQNYINKEEYKNIDIYESWDIDRENSYHIELARWADEFIIYPATANIVSKLSSGIADDIHQQLVDAIPAIKLVQRNEIDRFVMEG